MKDNNFNTDNKEENLKPNQEKTERFIQAIAGKMYRDKNLKNVYNRDVFRYLLENSNYTENEYRYTNNGEEKTVLIKRAERVTSLETISNDTGIKKSNVRNAINRLKKVKYLDYTELIKNRMYLYKLLKYDDFLAKNEAHFQAHLEAHLEAHKKGELNTHMRHTSNSDKPLDDINENEINKKNRHTSENRSNGESSKDEAHFQAHLEAHNNNNNNNKDKNNRDNIERENKGPAPNTPHTLENWQNIGKHNNIPDEVTYKAFHYYKGINFKRGKNEIADIESTLILFYDKHLKIEKSKSISKTKKESKPKDPKQSEIEKISKDYFNNTNLVNVNLVKYFLDLTNGDFEEVKRHLEELVKNNFKKIATMETATIPVNEIQPDGTTKIKLTIKPREENENRYNSTSKSKQHTDYFDPERLQADYEYFKQFEHDNNTSYTKKQPYTFSEERLKADYEYLKQFEHNPENGNDNQSFMDKIFNADYKRSQEKNRKQETNKYDPFEVINENEKQTQHTSSDVNNETQEQQLNTELNDNKTEDKNIQVEQNVKTRNEENRKTYNQIIIQIVTQTRNEPTEEDKNKIQEDIKAGINQKQIIKSYLSKISQFH